MGAGTLLAPAAGDLDDILIFSFAGDDFVSLPVNDVSGCKPANAIQNGRIGNTNDSGAFIARATFPVMAVGVAPERGACRAGTLVMLALRGPRKLVTKRQRPGADGHPYSGCLGSTTRVLRSSMDLRENRPSRGSRGGS